MRKMKIAYCIPGIYASGGMERVLSLKANYLAHQGHEIHIIVTEGLGKKSFYPLDSSIIIHQLNIDFVEPYRHSLIYQIYLYKLRMITLRKRLNECLCQIKPDITVSLLCRDINILNRMTDGSLKMGEIHFDKLHFRVFNASWLPQVVNTFIRRQWMNDLIRKLKKLSKFVVLTYEDAMFWPELQNLIVIPNPVPFFPETFSTCTQKQVIAVGRYAPQKGFDRLIPAWRKVIDKHPDWTLKIYGDGWMREQLQQQIIKMDLNENCFLEHTATDIIGKYQESSIFVLSSRFEGFGMVIVEAMACGLPAISFTCNCGPRDIISDGVDGILVSEGDIEKLAEKMNLLIEDSDLRQKMGKMARLKAEKYKMEHVGPQWTCLFESLLKQGKM